MTLPSMKVPPKRKGNGMYGALSRSFVLTLNESPSEKEGKSNFHEVKPFFVIPSMKVPPKRKGNPSCKPSQWRGHGSLNESPSEKEGKSGT